VFVRNANRAGSPNGADTPARGWPRGVDADHPPISCTGRCELETTEYGLLPHRLPAWARAQAADELVLQAESQPAGVRLVFRSRATEVELDAHRVVIGYAGVPPRPDCFYDLLRRRRARGADDRDRGDVVETDLSTGTTETRRGPTGTVRFAGLPDRDKLVELWLPWSETTHLVALRTDAPVAP
jgi:hypothetical protein